MRNIYSIEIIYPEDPSLEAMAERLAKELSSYRIPASVVKKTGIRSLDQVTEPWLIVLCSPECRDSAEVRGRIAAYTAEGRYHNILSLLVKGRSGDSFPEELVYETRPDGTVVEHEPLAANIVADSERESLRLLQVEKLRLLAPILGVSFDELRNRRLRTRIRVAAALGTVVMLGAAAFFIYAVSRMSLISGQNKDLELKYAQAQEARDQAQAQRDAAREEFAGTTAIRARDVLDRKNSELAMLLCLEFLPEAGRTTELPGILSEALEGLCKKGYVPVTSVREYGKDRYQPDPEEPNADARETDGAFPKKITRPVPEEFDNGKETFSLTLTDSSEEYGYAVYSGYFNVSKTSGNSITRNRICFLNDPERDYDMPCRDEVYNYLSVDTILSDGSIIGREHYSLKDSLFRFDPFTREFLPFYDEVPEPLEMQDAAAFLPGDPEVCLEAGIHVDEVRGTPADDPDFFSPYALNSDIQKFQEIPGVDGLIFGYTYLSTSVTGTDNSNKRTHVFSGDPFRYLYTIEGVIELTRLEDSNYLLGMTGEKLLVFSAEPFRYLYTLEDEFTVHVDPIHYELPYFPDGRQWMYVHGSNGKAVYDLEKGERLCAITDPGQEYSMEISADGLILSSVRKIPVLWRPEDGSVFREIPDVEEDEPELFGPYDEATGRRCIDAIRVGNIVYEYREQAVPIPEDLQGRVELALQLLGNRQLSKKERKTYGLELTDIEESPDDAELPDAAEQPDNTELTGGQAQPGTPAQL